jgi:hypothetical protein
MKRRGNGTVSKEAYLHRQMVNHAQGVTKDNGLSFKLYILINITTYNYTFFFVFFS